jgi:protein-tyrosine phosphatase
VIDFHNHLLPAVDDGAMDLAESERGLAALFAQGVRTVIATCHIDATVTTRPVLLAQTLERVDAAWEAVRELAEERFPELVLYRGVELALDTPTPDLTDPRLRLAGSSFVLVEFPRMTVPPNSAASLHELKRKGWTPIVAHPERYHGLSDSIALFEEWRESGALLQVNCGSLLGRYGDLPRACAWELLRLGWADYLASDYHARGRCPVAEAREKLDSVGGAGQADLLLRVNPGRILTGEQPEPVPPLEHTEPSFWRQLLHRVRSRTQPGNTLLTFPAMGILTCWLGSL